MKIVILDGYALNPGDLSWDGLERYGELIVYDRTPGFMVDHFVKDMGIALDEVEAMHLCLPALALVKQLYIALQAMGKGSLGTQSL